MRKLLFMIFLTTIAVGCQQTKKPEPIDVSASVKKIMSVDEIYKIEHIL